MKPYRIKIYTRSANLELYEYAKGLFSIPNIPVVRLTDTTSDSYLYQILNDKNCDIAINIDEDAFIVDTKRMLNLVDYMLENDYVNCGMPDGGALVIRGCNPIVTNPFFNIINLVAIRKQMKSIKDIKNFKYSDVKQQLIEQYPAELLKSIYDFDCSDFEPYYPFFFYTAYHFRTLYLPSKTHTDGVSTILCDPQGEAICYHSWWSRGFGKDPFHTKRILALKDEAYAITQKVQPTFGTSLRARMLVDKQVRFIVKWIIRIKKIIVGLLTFDEAYTSVLKKKIGLAK